MPAPENDMVAISIREAILQARMARYWGNSRGNTWKAALVVFRGVLHASV